MNGVPHLVSLLLVASPMSSDAFWTVWAIKSSTLMPRQLKAYMDDEYDFVSKLRLPEAAIDLILDYGCSLNDYLLVHSSPPHYNFEVWAMWANDLDDISDALAVNAYHRRFLGTWNYMHLMCLLCVGFSVTPYFPLTLWFPWVEAFVQRNEYPGGRGCWVTIRHYMDPLIWWQLRKPVVSLLPPSPNLFDLVVPPLFRCLSVYRAYWQDAGPMIPIFICRKSQDVMRMLMAMPVPSSTELSFRAVMEGAYAQPWRMGDWLTDEEFSQLSPYARERILAAISDAWDAPIRIHGGWETGSLMVTLGIYLSLRGQS